MTVLLCVAAPNANSADYRLQMRKQLEMQMQYYKQHLIWAQTQLQVLQCENVQ